MADITKTNHKGLGLPKHFDPSMEQMKKNMEVIDDILQKAVPNDLASDSEGEASINALTTTGRYLVKSNATGYPVSGYAGVVDVFRVGTYILQEWRSITTSTYVYRRYSTNSGSSWNGWIKDWNANNDGSGSGLDADLLDGKHSSAFAQTNTTAYTDFNSVPLVVGMYGVSGTSSNSPVSATGTYSVIVTKTSTGYMMLAINNVDSNIYRRHTTGAWSASTSWTKVGSGTGLQKASATFVTSDGLEDSTSNYLKVTREEPSSELNAGDIIAVTLNKVSSSTLTYTYMYSVDDITFSYKQLYTPTGSTQIQPVQIPRYFLLEYNGSTFNIISPLADSNFVISDAEPTGTSSKPVGTVWFRYYSD